MIGLALALALAAAEPPSNPVAPAIVQAETRKERARRLREEAANRIVCRKVKPTGSNLREDVCRPKREWDQLQRAGASAMENVQREGLNTFIAGHH